jgi:hypothetical protein
MPFDSRRLDEVNFDVRLTAFQEATRRINDMDTLDMNFIYTVMHTVTLQSGLLTIASTLVVFWNAPVLF